MIDITSDNKNLRTMILMHLVEMAARGDIEGLAESGLPYEEIDKLRQMSSEDIMSLAGNTYPLITLQIRPETLHMASKSISMIKEKTRTLKYFVDNGASSQMIKRFFRTDNLEIKNLRKQSSSPLSKELALGRPKLPDEDGRDQIHDAWTKIRASNPNGDEKVLYILLHEKFPNLTLATLDAVINEFKESK